MRDQCPECGASFVFPPTVDAVHIGWHDVAGGPSVRTVTIGDEQIHRCDRDDNHNYEKDRRFVRR